MCAKVGNCVRIPGRVAGLSFAVRPSVLADSSGTVLDRAFQAGCGVARRMSEQLQNQIDSSLPSSGARSIAKALLISLGVHAVLLGVFWQLVSNRPAPAQRDVRVVLSPGAHPVAPLAAEHVPAAAAPERSEHPLRTHSAQAVL